MHRQLLPACLAAAVLLPGAAPAQDGMGELLQQMEEAINQRDGVSAPATEPVEPPATAPAEPPATAPSEPQAGTGQAANPFDGGSGQTQGTAPAARGTPAPVAGMVDGTDPVAVLRAATTIGEATLTRDSEGDPLIEGTTEGYNYQVFFYGCEGGQNCTTILIGAGFDMLEPMSYDVVNSWNRAERFTRAYLDDELDPIVEVDVNLLYGVTEANLADTFDWWRIQLADFARHIGF